MRNFPFSCFVVLLTLILAHPAARGEEKIISRVGFGSCVHQDHPQPIWDAILGANPDAFLLIGDNIYGDSRDMQVLRRKYAQLDAVPGFAKLRASVPLLGTWDDHDYGENNAGVEYPMKQQSQQLLLDFFRVPADSPRRRQEGVYHAQVFGPPGQRVQVILLDTRYFRSPVKVVDGRPVPETDPRATILGPAQWRWLEEQFRQPAELRLVVSSVQVVSEGHFGEKWANFPLERERLYRLIRDANASGVVFLSGDRHFADLSVMAPAEGVGYPLYDLTSSGLTQASRKWRMLSPNTRRVAGMSFDTNFGLITVDWDRPDPLVSLQIRDEGGDIRINEKIPLSLLKPTPPATQPVAAPSHGKAAAGH